MSQSKVLVYTTQYCPYCSQAKNLLRAKKIEFQEIDITHDEKMWDIIEQRTGATTVPQIFINDEYIGGFEQLYQLDKKDLLKKLL